MESMERMTQAAVALLRKALEVDADAAKKEFSAPHFRILNRRADYSELAEKFKIHQ
jgi:hypothetical protein